MNGAQRTPLRHRFVDTSVGQIHVASVVGPTGRLPLLMLPQWPFMASHYRFLLPRLAGHVATHVIDLPGFGYTPATPEPLDVREAGALLVEVADALEAPQVVLFGRAAGSVIAMEAARQQPRRVAGLFLHGPFVHSAEERQRKRSRAWSPASPVPDGSHLLAYWTRVVDRYPELPADVAHECALAHASASPQQAASYRAVWDYDAASTLASLEMPIRALVGRGEVLGALRHRYPANVSAVDADAVPAVTDFLAVTHPDLLAEHILRFARQVAGRRAS